MRRTAAGLRAVIIFVAFPLAAANGWAQESTAPSKDTPATAAAATSTTPSANRAQPPSPLNPEANEFPKGPAVAPPSQYDDLLAQIAALRSRVAALMTSLFTSKLIVNVQSDSSDAHITSLVLTLDGGVVYSSNSLETDDERKVYEHSVAPGTHLLGLQVERADARGKQYTSFQQSRFSVLVPAKKKLEAVFSLEDDSDMAEAFPSGESGEYLLKIKLFAHVVE